MAAILIVGCGYLGKVLGSRALALGHRVIATTRRAENCAALTALGFTALALDLEQPVDTEIFRTEQPTHVAVLLPPGTLGADGNYTTRAAISRLLQCMQGSAVVAGVLASSTAVYGLQDSGTVDADTAALPNDAKGLGLREIEHTWEQAPFPARVLRLAGLYGPGRIIGARQLLAAQPVTGDPDRLLNLIHVEDAAELLLRILLAKSAARYELGSDGHPISRREYYQYLAQRLGVQVNFDTAAAPIRPSGSRACAMALTCARTGWVPQYRSFQVGLNALLPPP